MLQREKYRSRAAPIDYVKPVLHIGTFTLGPENTLNCIDIARA